jgi:cytosine/adenosine deaminase-related metal-dependent hydrolase
LYRKFTANYIFNGNEILTGKNVLITDKIGTIIELLPIADAGDNIEYFEGMLSPGFINAHCHLELSHMKGHIPQHTGLINFILKVVFERNFEEAIILSAIEKAENEMLQNGIVAVGDICNNAITITQKSKSKLQYHNFIETSGFIGATAKTRLKTSEDIYQAFATVLPTNSIVPHAPYSVSPELFGLINNYPNNKTLTIHNQETAAENELFQHKEGDFLAMYQQMNIDISGFNASSKSSLQTYLPALNNYQSLILVHNVCTNTTDIEFEKLHTLKLQPSTFNPPPSTCYCLCPNANLYITGQLPDVNLLVEQQCNIVLGTDSLASNHQLSILEEIKTLQQHFANIPLQTMLHWATLNGAKALQTDGTLGSFDKGKTPGVVLIDQLNGLSLTEASSSKRIL